MKQSTQKIFILPPYYLISKYKSMKNKNLEFIVSESNVESFNRTLQIIFGFLANNNDVPVVTVKYLLSILLSKNDFKYKTRAQKAKKASQYVSDFISNHKDYQLDWKLKGIEIGKSTKYDFSLFAQLMLQAYFQFNYEHGEKDLKIDAVHFFYKTLIEELDTSKMNLKEGKISDYKIYVMAGVFAISAGHTISTKSPLKPQEIYNAVRNTIKKKSKII